MMLSKLPGWVISDVESTRREVAEWRDLDRAERWALAQACSKDALWAISVSGDPQRILDRTDPLPESSRAALARLRAQTGWNGGAS